MSILAYLYLLATLHLTSSRGHVEELQHTLALKHAVSAIPMRRLEEKPLVALILRGQAFRFGQQLQMKTHTRPQPQAHALASVVNNLVVPLEEVGWRVELLAHVFILPVKGEYDSYFMYYKYLLAGNWSKNKAPRYLQVENTHNETQRLGIKATLAWAERTAPEIWAAASHFILTRVDLEWKVDINLPTPHLAIGKDSIIILYMMPPDKRRTPRIADTFFWIPRRMIKTFGYALDAQVIRDMGTHEMDKVLPIQVLYHSLHRVDSHFGWNPAYIMSGRDLLAIQHPSKVNGDPPTIWTAVHEQIFVRLWNSSALSLRHRADFLRNGLGGPSMLQITIELNGIHPPPSLYPGDWREKKISSLLNPTSVETGLLVVDYCLYLVHQEHGSMGRALYVQFPTRVNRARIEVTWVDIRHSTRTIGNLNMVPLSRICFCSLIAWLWGWLKND